MTTVAAPSPAATDAIVVHHLTKRYGSLTAVNDVSFTVKRGEVFAFLGPNGAGKSTTVEVIETIRKPTSGTVTLLGMDVTRRKSDIVRRIGVLPQGFSSFDRITVRESIVYYARLFDVKNADIDALVELTNLRDKQHVQFKNLSGGLKQRLGIAIALVNDPEVVFLDEPTTGLDPHARRDVWKVLLDLKKKGKTVFLTTHYLEEAELLADTVAIISKGRIVATGSPEHLIETNANYTCVTLKSDDARLPGLIRSLGFEPTALSASSVKIQLASAAQVQGLLASIQSAGLELSGIDVRKPNLEEVFLKLTGEELDPGAENPEGSP